MFPPALIKSAPWTSLHDQLAAGRSILVFDVIDVIDVIDDVNFETLSIEVNFSVPPERMILGLKQIIEWRGKPSMIQCDNGPE